MTTGAMPMVREEEPLPFASRSSAPPPPTTPSFDDEPAPESGGTLVGALPRGSAGDAWPGWSPEASLSDSPPEAITLERYGALRATMDAQPDAPDAVLAAERVDPEAFEDAEHRLTTWMTNAAQRGDTQPLTRFDEAYVEALRATRQDDLGVGVFARLQVAAERGMLDEAMARHAFPTAALAPFARHLMRQLVATPALRQEMNAAMARARQDG